MLYRICHPHHCPVQQPSVLHRKCFSSQVKNFPALKSSYSHVRIAATFVPAINPDDSLLPLPPISSEPPSAPPKPAFKGSLNSPRTQEWRVYAENTSNNGGWPKHDESALNKCEPLPLPMVYPGATPNPLEVKQMKECNPEKTDCQDVLYQWTGKCSRCQGTGEVSYFRKKGREVICKCIACMGLGYVHKMTRRTDIELSDGMDGAL